VGRVKVSAALDTRHSLAGEWTGGRQDVDGTSCYQTVEEGFHEPQTANLARDDHDTVSRLTITFPRILGRAHMSMHACDDAE